MDITWHTLTIQSTPENLPNFNNMSQSNYLGFCEATFHALAHQAYQHILEDEENEDYLDAEIENPDGDNTDLIRHNHWSVLKLPIEFMIIEEDDEQPES